MNSRACLLSAAIFTMFYGVLSAQNFAIAPSQLDICVAPGFNHTPLRLAIQTNAPNLNLADLMLACDSKWVVPSVDAAGSSIVLSFVTSNLINQSYTATVTASLKGQTNSIFVRANIAPLVIFKLKDDPWRSRTYGIQQNGLGVGSIVVLDPVTTNYIGNITVGKKPTDLAESADGRELFVINCVDETISVLDLVSLTLKETLTLPAFDNWASMTPPLIWPLVPPTSSITPMGLGRPCCACWTALPCKFSRPFLSTAMASETWL